MDRLEIVLGEQMEGAEDLVVLKIERPRGFEIALEGSHGGRLDDELLWCAGLAELLMLGRSDPGCPPRSAPMVIVGMGGNVGRVAITEILGHGG